MTYITIVLIICSISGLLMAATTPLIITLFLFTLAISITLYLFYFSSWISIIMFLIYIGGVIVIFSYFVAVTPNPIINYPSLPIWPTLLFSTIAFQELYTESIAYISLTTTQTPVSSILNSPLTLLFLALILLFILIVVTNTSTRNQGSLRPHL